MKTGKSVYEIVTERVVEMLDKGVVPWHKTWTSTTELPKNFKSGKPYRGINVWLLLLCGYNSPYWLSFKQVESKGGTVCKGEKGSLVVYWNWHESVDEKTGKIQKIPFLRYYTVWNETQIDGIEFPAKDARNNNPIEDAEKVVQGYSGKPEVTYGFRRASYSPLADQVSMPNMGDFNKSNDFYATLFHELVHSTGHSKRLGRMDVTEPSMFGSPSYAKEELIAEMGAAFLCATTGIDSVIENQAAYIKEWKSRLEDNPKLIVMASASAQKATDHILGKILVIEN